jgi:hypothetical protein
LRQLIPGSIKPESSTTIGNVLKRSTDPLTQRLHDVCRRHRTVFIRKLLGALPRIRARGIEMDQLRHAIITLGPYIYGFIFTGLFVYSLVNYFWIRRALEQLGREYCVTHGHTFVAIKHAKAHCSVVYRNEAKKKQYAKFRVRVFCFKVRNIEWLK